MSYPSHPNHRKSRRRIPVSHPPRRVNRPAVRASRAPRKAADARRSRRLALGTLYAILILTLSVALLASPAMRVKQLIVEGTADLTPTEVAEVTRCAQLPARTNWLLAPLNTQADRIRALPSVRVVEVERRFPNEIAVRITPRQSCALVQIGAERLEVEETGVPVRVAGPDSLARLPLITLDRPFPVQLGVPIVSDGLHAAIQVCRAVRQDPLVRIAKVVVDRSDNICLNMQDGIVIRFGPSDELSEKLATVHRIYSRQPDVAHTLSAIDLTCLNAPACTRRVVPSTPAAAIGVQTTWTGSTDSRSVH